MLSQYFYKAGLEKLFLNPSLPRNKYQYKKSLKIAFLDLFSQKKISHYLLTGKLETNIYYLIKSGIPQKHLLNKYLYKGDLRMLFLNLLSQRRTTRYLPASKLETNICHSTKFRILQKCLLNKYLYKKSLGMPSLNLFF